MKEFLSLLNTIDIFFNNKSSNEKILYILMMSLVAPYFIHSYFIPDLEKSMKYEMKLKNDINVKVVKNKQYIKSIKVNNNKNYYINKYDKDILDVKNKIRTINDNRQFIDKELKHLSKLLFHRANWSKFLNNISSDAKATNVDIINIENKYINLNNSKFGHVLDISIDCTGEYQKLVNFFGKLERNILITDIHETKLYISKDEKHIVANIKLSIWGINI